MTSMDNGRPTLCRKVTTLALLFTCLVAFHVEAAMQSTEAIASVVPHKFSSWSEHHPDRKLGLVQPPPLTLTYHNGPLMTVGPVIPVYLIWYGSFRPAQQSTFMDFFASFSLNQSTTTPSIGNWWNLTSGYEDGKGLPVAPSTSVEGQVFLSSKKKSLSILDLQTQLVRSLKKFPANSNAMYVVLTAPDVQVESFCMDSCASHFFSNKTLTKGVELPYIWVGNPAVQCPGLCAWPYAKPAYGPPDFHPLLPPNNDVGIDGMLISLGSMLAGIATNPYDTGYYEGDTSAPVEAATACAGIYGAGAYPGYPGDLLQDPTTKVSYNANGINNRKFLMPTLWNPLTSLCTPP